jgi:hypothetical protein
MARSQSGFEPLIGRRVALRTRCDLMVEMKDGTSGWTRALLTDFSATGCRLTRIGNPPHGGSIWLRPPGMAPIAAKVRWAADGAIGCEFLFALDAPAQAQLGQLAGGAAGPDAPPVAARDAEWKMAWPSL